MIGAMKHMYLKAPILATLTALSGGAWAQSQDNGSPAEALCRTEAERLSGYHPLRLSADVGGVHMELHGSAAVGVSKSWGGTARSAPPFAGEANRERRDAMKQKKYQQYFDDCIQRNAQEPRK
ncbi:MAG: hypothetical protein AB7E21_01510 [Pseudodonghicola sp.]